MDFDTKPELRAGLIVRNHFGVPFLSNEYSNQVDVTGRSAVLDLFQRHFGAHERKETSKHCGNIMTLSQCYNPMPKCRKRLVNNGPDRDILESLFSRGAS